jgi:hypothetical protein
VTGERRQTLARIKITRDGDVSFEFPGDPDPLPSFTLRGKEPLFDAWARAGRALECLVEGVPVSSAQAVDLREPLNTLLSAGRELGERLTAGNINAWNKVQRRFTMRRAALSVRSGPPEYPVVEVESIDHGYPVELLPVFNIAGAPEPLEIQDERQLRLVADRFIGFNAIVSRIAPNRQLGAAELTCDPLPIRFFRYHEPEEDDAGSGFADEQVFLDSLDGVQLDGPYPIDGVDADAARTRVLAALYDARRPLDPRKPPDAHPAALAHFACHCYTAQRVLEEFELVLSSPDGTPCQIFKTHLTDGYSKPGEDPEADLDDVPPRAAVILNACGTSSVDPWSTLSFQDFFLDNDHPAFLGTQAAIPSTVAAQFTRYLYGSFLAGRTLGAAVVEARRALLLDHMTPLGLLYALHGNDRIRVAQAP